jgi:hypothetical protein
MAMSSQFILDADLGIAFAGWVKKYNLRFRTAWIVDVVIYHQLSIAKDGVRGIPDAIRGEIGLPVIFLFRGAKRPLNPKHSPPHK